ncbi:hypothetical protein [Frankia sp. AgB32]|uniref:hypothetical protein n=1 Tax=Frankia sp. AgB32 TaxID=631119 RepID=UPI00200C18AB|nr:hypothetical protein [Frankia sp. AgB32]MCK9898409.1 hypothetical protein [Frankia sp. AgB32]
MSTVVGLAFLFGFGNGWTLALRLGVPGYLAPLVAPAVDLSVIGLLVGIRILVIFDVAEEVLRSARILLMFCRAVTLALNVAEPIIAKEYGKDAFDAVGPMLLIGWAEVGPSLMQAMRDIAARDQRVTTTSSTEATGRGGDDAALQCESPAESEREDGASTAGPQNPDFLPAGGDPQDFDELLPRALDADFKYWLEHRRPIPADKLGKILGVGSTKSRKLVVEIRTARRKIIKDAMMISIKEIEPPGE